MMRVRVRMVVRLVAALAMPTMAMPALAHHSFAADYDEKKPVTLRGTVTKFDWSNPHVLVYLDVIEGGKPVNYATEWESRIELKRAGWKADSVKPESTL